MNEYSTPQGSKRPRILPLRGLWAVPRWREDGYVPTPGLTLQEQCAEWCAEYGEEVAAELISLAQEQGDTEAEERAWGLLAQIRGRQ